MNHPNLKAIVKLSSQARQFVAHLSKKEFKSAAHLFVKEIYPSHVYDPYISPTSYAYIHESSLSHLLSTSIAAFSNVQLSLLEDWLAVDSKTCEHLVVKECQTNGQWLIDEKRHLLVRRQAKKTSPTDVFERVVTGLQQANLQAIMACSGKDSWAELAGLGDKDQKGKGHHQYA